MYQKWKCEDDLLCGVNKPKDEHVLSTFEKQHVPGLYAPELVHKEQPFDVSIKVGGLQTHPSEPRHFIEWVELYCGDTFIARAQFSAADTYPEVTFRVMLWHAKGSLRVWAKCNQHGLWQTKREINVI